MYDKNGNLFLICEIFHVDVSGNLTRSLTGIVPSQNPRDPFLGAKRISVKEYLKEREILMEELNSGTRLKQIITREKV